jgi:hypothetical protein
LVLAFSLTAFGAAYAAGAAAGLKDIEREYADFLDAHSANETINSGLMTTVGGHDRVFWTRERALKVAYLSKYFKALKYKTYNTHEVIAIASMRHTFEELTAAGSDSSAPNAACADARSSMQDAPALHASLYACFDSPGNQMEFEGQRLTRVAALQLLQEIPQADRRKALFMAAQPLWLAVNGNNESGSPYRRLIAAAAPDFARGQSPIHAAAAAFGVGVPEAERWLVAVLESWRAVNAAAPGAAAQGIEPWDYRFNYSLASRTLATAIGRDALLPLQQQFYHDLGADPKTLGVVFDLEPRPGKAPLAYADTIRIGRRVEGRWRPAIVRVSANDDRGGLGILNELVHESGHAVHFMAIRARPAFFWPDITFCEAFADVTSWSVYTPAWQQRYLHASLPRADNLREQYAGVMLDVAWSLFELRMLREPATDPNLLWTDITHRYLGIVPHPELSWWAMRSQLVTDPGYMINYGLGALITAEVRAKTTAAIGSIDAGNARWYPWISANLLRFGGDPDTPKLLRRFLGHAVTPAALTADIASIGAAPTSH